MGSGYQVIEEAVRAKLQEHLAIQPGACTAGDLDSIFEVLFSSVDADRGIVLEFGGGGFQNRHPFKEQIWVWTIAGAMFLPLKNEETIETYLRESVDRLRTVFEQDPRLGVASLLTLSDIGNSEPMSVNETPFYWLPFTIEALDK